MINEFMIFLMVLVTIEFELIYLLVRKFKKRFDLSLNKIHFLTLISLFFLLLMNGVDFDSSDVFVVLVLSPFAYFYALVMLVVTDFLKGNVYALVGVTLLFGVFPFYVSSSVCMGVIVVGVVTVLPIVSYHVLFPLYSKNKIEYVLKNVAYMLVIEALFQGFLLCSAHLAYDEAVKLEVNDIEKKSYLDFYDATLKEIYIDNETRWSYHRFKYVNQWD